MVTLNINFLNTGSFITDAVKRMDTVSIIRKQSPLNKVIRSKLRSRLTNSI